ncbi:hypothetical protein M378DRAFT_820820 [Amanita muscaria Koide BX008]|uniref:Uncharacterized protein n=1 Tax=Amanita muscaria (strain Koide BX008) TaxID=946122 RepID=A0A0C2WZB0_AMAMK|nr:hypothetical protein M378DRAFT_820820 [Amanita muscaria Koide BX008]
MSFPPCNFENLAHCSHMHHTLTQLNPNCPWLLRLAPQSVVLTMRRPYFYFQLGRQ